MILDMTDHIAKFRTLDAPPFPIKYCHTTVHVSIVDKSQSQVSIVDIQPVVKLIEDLERHFAEAVNPQPITTCTSPKHISLNLMLSMQLSLRILITLPASKV
jgi:hypothetical protein